MADLTGTVSVSMKVNLGNYQSQDIFVSVSGIDSDTTPQEVTDLLRGPITSAYDLVLEQVEKRATEARGGVGGTAPTKAGGKEAPAPVNVLAKRKFEVVGPKMVWAPKIEHLRRQELAVFVQLRAAEWPESAGTDTPEGSILRESLRAVLMGEGTFDRDSEKDMERWLTELTRHRDEVLEPKGVEG